jgi:hypothetical protein
MLLLLPAPPTITDDDGGPAIITLRSHGSDIMYGIM